MNTPDVSTTRRALIGGGSAVVATMLLATGAVARARPLPRPNDRLRRAIALHDRADAECARFDVEVEMPARKACGAAIAAYQTEAPPPHEQVATTFVNAFDDTVRLSTDRIGADAVARKVVGDPTWADMGDEDWRQAHRELAAAHARRNAVLGAQAQRKQQFEAETRAKFKLHEIAARSDALDARRYRLWNFVLAIPAAGWTDVTAKLDFISRTVMDDEVGQHEFAAVAGDVRRLAGEA